MCAHLQKSNFNDVVINNLKKFLNLEEFDTESVSMDVVCNDDEHDENGNISKAVNNKQCIVAIKRFIAESLCMLYVCFS